MGVESWSWNLTFLLGIIGPWGTRAGGRGDVVIGGKEERKRGILRWGDIGGGSSRSGRSSV